MARGSVRRGWPWGPNAAPCADDRIRELCDGETDFGAQDRLMAWGAVDGKGRAE